MVLGIKSNGLHSNGFSLVRKILKANKVDYNSTVPWASDTFGELLKLNENKYLFCFLALGKVFLTPTRIYVRSLLPLMKEGLIKGAAHITGGGITGKAINYLALLS